MTDVYETVAEVLEDRGCYRVEVVNENAEIWHNPKKDRPFTVPRPLPRHTARRIVREELDEAPPSLS